MRLMAVFAVMCTSLLSAQTASTGDGPWNALRFLEGTWDAKTQGEASGVNANGTYSFRKELAGHVLARHSSASGCKGPADFDCEHTDLLYVYQDMPGLPLQAIYFDNEGHVIHYSVSTPTPASAVFLSDPSAPGPQFRLAYELKRAVMSGKFQMRMPGKAEWTSYLEWSGAKK
jgi:uncharacterized protein YaiE (UPF0345 family)